MKLNLAEYTREEIDAIIKGEKLLAPETLTARWGISLRELHKLVNGNHNSGAHLPAVRFGSKTTRFRVVDVIKVEHEMYGRDFSR
jgi:hypothetical protein